MKVQESEAPILLAKKFGGLLLLVLGLLLLAMGFNADSIGLTVLGIVALACGAVLLALKIRRRNQGN
jgi:hypothetical protein